MDFDRIKERITGLINRLTGSKRAMTIAAALGLLGMLMILFSGGGDNERDKEIQVPADTDTDERWADYRHREEEELASILAAIDGVGKVRVMITVSGSEEYVYAESIDTAEEKEEHEYVILKKGSEEEALVQTVKAPVIKGVVVVCEGADSDRVKERVYRAVTAALSIPTTLIYVAPME